MRLRPHRNLLWQGLIAVIAFMTPVFVVLYVLTLPSGPWRAVLVTHILATIVVTFGAAAYFRVAIDVDRDGVSEVGFFGRRTTFRTADIARVLCADLFDGSASRTIPQLFVVGRDGSQLLRMRGQFWSRDDMDTVISTLGVPREVLDESMSAGELRKDYPSMLYWFERHPILAALVFSLGTIAVGLIVYLVFRLFDVA